MLRQPVKHMKWKLVNGWLVKDHATDHGSCSCFPQYNAGAPWFNGLVLTLFVACPYTENTESCTSAILSSLVEPEVVVITAYSAASGDNVGFMAIASFQCTGYRLGEIVYCFIGCVVFNPYRKTNIMHYLLSNTALLERILVVNMLKGNELLLKRKHLNQFSTYLYDTLIINRLHELVTMFL